MAVCSVQVITFKLSGNPAQYIQLLRNASLNQHQLLHTLGNLYYRKPKLKIAEICRQLQTIHQKYPSIGNFKTDSEVYALTAALLDVDIWGDKEMLSFFFCF